MSRLPDAASRPARRRARRAGAARLAFAAALSAAISTASAQGRERDSDFDEDGRPWKEIEARMPSYPGSGDLVPFDAGAASPHRFYLDARSLSIGEDGVVRYTLVLKSAGGATNVTFEGIRCESRERKVYAVGRPDGTWVRVRNLQWRRIDLQGADAHHRTLYAEYLCSNRVPVRSVREVLQKLRHEAPVSAGQ